MKLHTLSTIFFPIITLFIFIVIAPINLYIVRQTFYIGIDNFLDSEFLEISNAIKDTKIPGRLNLSNNVWVEEVKHIKTKPKKKLQTVEMQDATGKIQNYHRLIDYCNHHNTWYKVTIDRPISDLSFRIMIFLIACMTLMFAVIWLLFSIISSVVNNTLWQPFYSILNEINNYNIEGNYKPTFFKTAIAEFNELQKSITAMVNRNQAHYQSQKEFIQNSSHELKTPLAVIKQNLDNLIQSKKLGKQEMEHISIVYENVRRLNQMNNSLSTLYKIENQHYVSQENINLPAIITEHIEQLRFVADSKKIQIKSAFPNTFKFTANQELMHILFSNIISNALKHGVENGYFTITGKNNIWVFENLGRVLSHNTEGLFERFVKVVPENDSMSQGLGLSIVKKICELYQIELQYTYIDAIHRITLAFPIV